MLKGVIVKCYRDIVHLCSFELVWVSHAIFGKLYRPVNNKCISLNGYSRITFIYISIVFTSSCPPCVSTDWNYSHYSPYLYAVDNTLFLAECPWEVVINSPLSLHTHISLAPRYCRSSKCKTGVWFVFNNQSPSLLVPDTAFTPAITCVIRPHM